MNNIFDRDDMPYRYYHDLRSSSELSYDTSSSSRVIEVPEEELRLLHVSHLILTTSPFSPIRKPFAPQFTLTSVAAFMAMIHFNQRNELLVPGLKDRLQGCDLYLTMDMLDSKFSPIFASRQIIEAMSRDHSLATPRPGGVVGAFASTTTIPLATLTSADQIPHVGGIPAAHVFDNKDQYPTFARTVPTTDGQTAATIELLQHLNVSHVGLMSTVTEYGKSFAGFFHQMAAKADITVTSVNFVSDDQERIQRACEKIKATGFRYIVIAGDLNTIDRVLEIAYETGITGPGFQWMITGGVPSGPKFEATRTSLINALNGILSVDLDISGSNRLLGSLMGSMNDPEFTSFFVDSHPESFIWDNYAFNETPPIINRFAYTQYDAVMAVGISACETNSRSFTGLEHYDKLKNTTFTGASGEIEFDSTTGTRKLGSLKYAFTSLHIDHELSTNEAVVFTSQNPITVDFTRDDPVIINTVITFSDNTTTAPPPLPPVGEIDQNLIPQGIRIVGWVLAGLMMILSFGFAAYTYRKRQTASIRASQPMFLGMLCLGTMMMASSIVPLSLQEPVPKEGLDIACMSVPWLYTIGFSTAFSALFTKAWRINKVIRNSVEMQRVQVRAGDVIWPFVLLSMTNVTILTTWTVIAPLQWTRNISSTDQYGRGLETYGGCSFAADSSSVFLLLLAIFNGLVVVFANYQSYIGRKNPSDFNESRHLAISMASLLECFLIGGPILLLVTENPEVNFSVKAILIFVSCCAILLPMFIPKFTAEENTNSIDDMHRSMARIAKTRKSQISRTSREDGSDLRKLEYINTRSSRFSNESGDHFDSEQHRATRRPSQTSNDSELASSVDQLRQNALRSSKFM